MSNAKPLADLLIALGAAYSVALALLSFGAMFGLSPFYLELLGYLLGGAAP